MEGKNNQPHLQLLESQKIVRKLAISERRTWALVSYYASVYCAQPYKPVLHAQQVITNHLVSEQVPVYISMRIPYTWTIQVGMGRANFRLNLTNWLETREEIFWTWQSSFNGPVRVSCFMACEARTWAKDFQKHFLSLFLVAILYVDLDNSPVTFCSQVELSKERSDNGQPCK